MKDKVAPQPQPQQEKKAEKSPSDIALETLTRRSIFGAGVVGIAAVLAQACSGSDFASGTKNSSTGKNGKKPGAPDAGDGGGTGTGKNKKGGKDGGGADSDAGDSGADSGNLPPDASDGPGGPDSSDADGPDSADAISGLQDAGGGADSDGGGDSGGMDSQNDTNNGNLDSGEDTDACFANTASEVDLANVPKAPAELTPTAKFYGKDESAMVALQFAGSPDIAQIIICKADGKLLALHGISGADKGGAGMRPIICDNLRLAGSDKIKVLIQSGDKRYVAEIAKEYFNKFNGMNVVDLSSGQTFPGNQSVAQFAEGVGTFNKDANVSYPNDFNPGSTRNLQTVKAGSSWTAGAGVKGTVTDIMGNQINISGSGLIEYQTFCTYVESGGTVYRTILRVG